MSLLSKPLESLDRGRCALRLMQAARHASRPRRLTPQVKQVALRSKPLETLERGWCAPRLISCNVLAGFAHGLRLRTLLTEPGFETRLTESCVIARNQCSLADLRP